jgi:hypothetical protein
MTAVAKLQQQYVANLQAELAEARAQLENRGLALEAAEEECAELLAQIEAKDALLDTFRTNRVIYAELAEAQRQQIAALDKAMREAIPFLRELLDQPVRIRRVESPPFSFEDEETK